MNDTTTVYKIIINDSLYSSWVVLETNNFTPVDININPIEQKLFSNDLFSLDKNGNIKIIHSNIRTSNQIPGVLILAGNKTYGRENKQVDGETYSLKKSKAHSGRLLYKCIPDDKSIPAFLIPYEMKQMEFSKVFKNMYITFSFSNWNEKHPHGLINQNIGDVDVLYNFYEYQLYCKALNTSINKFQKDTSKSLQNNSHDAFIENIKIKFPSIEDRTNNKDWHIYSIDPKGSLDFDDAFSIKEMNDPDPSDTETETNNAKCYCLSIYIANVTIWIDILNLWDSFSRRVSTIYLPDRKRPMLPSILSDCLFSLQEKNTRIALTMDIFIKNNEIINIKYSNCFVKLFKNYEYEEPDLLNNKNYQLLMEITTQLSQKYKYINQIKDSHDLVSYLMIFMNYYCAKELLKHKNGIFRSTIMKSELFVPHTIPADVANFIKITNSASGLYIDGKTIDNQIKTEGLRHELLELDAYIHITSPIRRLVDLLNIIKFQKNENIIELSPKADMFYEKWLADLDYINITMRSIRKIQTECSLLDICTNNPAIMYKTYDGYLYDKFKRNDGSFQYTVYLCELKMISKIISREEYNNFENKNCKLFLFHNEERFKKKIRVHIL